MRLLIVALSLLVFLPLSAKAGQVVTYQEGDTTLEGYIAYPDTDGPAPLILIVHQWYGMGAYERDRADMLAEQGYVAFAIDMYGQGVRPDNPQDASVESSKYKQDNALALRRLMAAYEYGKALSDVDASRIAIMGYCFGGTMALELARSGADLLGTVSFHGGLATQNPAGKDGIKGRVQVHHGMADPYVKPEETAAFIAEMQKANANLGFFGYPDAVHAFTEEHLGTDASQGAAYNEAADKRSWARTLAFFSDIF